MAAALRVAFLGDSWMGEWYYGTVVPTPIAVSARAILQECLHHGVEMTVVAFPGCTAMHALCLAEHLLGPGHGLLELAGLEHQKYYRHV